MAVVRPSTSNLAIFVASALPLIEKLPSMTDTAPDSVIAPVAVIAGTASVVPSKVKPLVVMSAVEPALTWTTRFATVVRSGSLSKPAESRAISARASEDDPCALVEGQPE